MSEDEIKTVDAVVTNDTATDSEIKRQFDERGHFAKGNTLAKGQTFERQPSKRQQYLNAFHSAIGFDEMRQVAIAMHAAACLGDVAAARLICDYNLGKPVQAIEIETSGSMVAGALQINLISPQA